MESRGLLREQPQSFPLLKSTKPAPRGWLRFRTRKIVRKPSRKISIIIPAHNEESYLELTLDSLKRQTLVDLTDVLFNLNEFVYMR